MFNILLQLPQNTNLSSTKMGEQYTIKIQNATDKPWCFAIYQKFPANQKMNSVAWQVLKLAPQIGDSPPPEKEFSWALDYGICIAEFDADDQKFEVNQQLAAQLGKHYEVDTINHIPTISQKSEVVRNHHHIEFQNKTQNPVKTLNMGFLIDNKLVAVEPDVGGHLSVSYPANPTYYVACYNSIDAGQLVEEGVALGPVKLDYEPGVSTHIVKAEQEQPGEYSLHTELYESTDYSNSLEEYQLVLQNATDQPWYFGVYQMYPEHLGLTSVAWQVCGLPPSLDYRPATRHIRWNMDFGICIAEFDRYEQKYVGVQYASASLNHSYEVISLDGIPSISTAATGSGRMDHLIVKNKTDTPGVSLSLGFTQSGEIAAIANIRRNQKAEYSLQPTYHVACYHNIVPGQLVDEGIAIGPEEVKYDAGIHEVTVEISKDPTGNYQLKTFIPSN